MSEKLEMPLEDFASAVAKENARLRDALRWFVEEYERTYFIRTADMHEPDCRCLRCCHDNAVSVLGDKL